MFFNISNRKCLLFVLFVLFVLGTSVYSNKALSFSCTSNSVSYNGAGTYHIPIDVTLDKDSTYTELTNLADYSWCQGRLGPYYRDALRTKSLSISPALEQANFVGVLVIDGITYTDAIQHCVWVDSHCTETAGTYSTNKYLKLKFGLQAPKNQNFSNVTIKKGSEIARLVLEQRSYISWGYDKTWVFTAKSDVIIHSHDCKLNTSNIIVTMPPVTKRALLSNGAGVYPEYEGFDVRLLCDTDTKVSIKFDGSTMKGHTDVLANSENSDGSVGFQIQHNGSPVILGQTLENIIGSANSSETLHFTSHYYYNGGDISYGNLTGTSTITLTYY